MTAAQPAGICDGAVGLVQQVAEIVARAQTLEERLARSGLSDQPWPQHQQAEMVQSWRQICGQGDPGDFRKRLAWSGLTPARLEAYLGDPPAIPRSQWPDWAEVLLDVLSTPRADARASANPATHSAHPFAAILAGFSGYAAQHLQTVYDDISKALGCDSRARLQDGLLRRLCDVAVQALMAEFQIFRRARLAGTMVLPGAHQAYDAFVTSLQDRAGLLGLFQKYPVLARLLATVLQQWVGFVRTFRDRLLADLPLLEQAFGFGGSALLELAGSDPHQGGQVCVKLVPQAGPAVFYKPKPLQPELVFEAFQAHLAALLGRPMRCRGETLDRGLYGWSKQVVPAACRDAAEVASFFRASGHLLFGQYLLGGADIHCDNLIAAGAVPVIIDQECLMTNWPAPSGDQVPAGVAAVRAMVFETVVRTSMLPEWNDAIDGWPLDISAFGGTGGPEKRTPELMVLHMNSDLMRLVRRVTPAERGMAHLPRYGGNMIDPADHVDDILQGFSEAYQALRRAPELPAGLVKTLQSVRARVVLRQSRAYGERLTRLCAPANLRNGFAAQLSMESLFQSLLQDPATADSLVPVVKSEFAQLMKMDVPVLHAQANGRAIQLPCKSEVREVFPASAMETLKARIARLGDKDLALQRQKILTSFACHQRLGADCSAWVQHKGQRPLANDMLPAADQPSAAVLERMGDDLLAQAIRGTEGSLAWHAPVYKENIGAWRMSPLRERVFDGALGIALFLAALTRHSGKKHYLQAGLNGISNLLESADRAATVRMLMAPGLGCGTGVGSAIYGLVQLARISGQDHLADVARDVFYRVEDLRSDDTPRTAKQDYGLSTGLSGYLNACLVLDQHQPGDARVLRALQDCVAQIAGAAVPDQAGGTHWPSPHSLSPHGPGPHGFAHGSAGVATVLLRAARHLQDERLLDLGRRGLRFALRQEQEGDLSWKTGGMGLCIAVQEALTVSDAQDLDLQNWHERQMGALSHHSGLVLDDLSFGEAARASVLQRSVDMCARPDLAADVRRAYRRLWGRADKGGFEFGWPAGVALPGFFQGTAGIGYQLLRRDFDVTLPDVFAFS
ncbi:type 2 lanthipeptide synthetase LanM [Pseudophaeobacter arcticus]|uniref:type 2 lanthipeptide synthetase LanM n=1 Tax=Pseudophaeobacter arcticus TaxID=385492 RepID=UPI0003F7C504|nr:type 2 lanthipeptide synthetase LanM [Pseudophaeobacter arcticus]